MQTCSLETLTEVPAPPASVDAFLRALGRPLRSLWPWTAAACDRLRRSAAAPARAHRRPDGWGRTLSRRQTCAFVFIGNLPHLDEAFGAEFAAATSREVARRLIAFIGARAGDRVLTLRDDCFLIWSERGTLPLASTDASLMNADLEQLLCAVAGEAVRFQAMAALARLHVGWIDVPDPRTMDAAETDLVLWAAQPAPDFQEPPSKNWRARYRADMETAVAVLEAARAGRMQMRWQPVIDAYASADTLYREGCVHLLPAPGRSDAPVALGSVLPCLERLQLTRELDRMAANQILEALRRSPEAGMSLNISANSARLDHWWATAFHALAQEPQVARRLVVEVGWAGAQWQDAEAMRDFCRRLAVCGCRIAIDHFAASAASLGVLQACKPDIVKLEAQFIRRAGESQFGFDSLKHALALCANLAPCTVVEGVDRAEDLGVALRAGARWMQGYYLGGPRAALPTSAPPNAAAPMTHGGGGCYPRRSQAEAKGSPTPA